VKRSALDPAEFIELGGATCCDWKDTPADILEMIDSQLAEYGLEVELHGVEGNEDDSYAWRIVPRC